MQDFKSVGIIVDNLGASQLSLNVLKETERFANRPDRDAIVFYKNLVPPYIKPMCCCMDISEIYGFNDILISTDIESAIFAAKSVNNSTRYFYVWDIEWMRKSKNWLSNMIAFLDRDTQLIARSKEHARLIKNYCNRDCVIITNKLNFEEVVQHAICNREQREAHPVVY
jgi:hypothetical protein